MYFANLKLGNKLLQHSKEGKQNAHVVTEKHSNSYIINRLIAIDRF